MKFQVTAIQFDLDSDEFVEYEDEQVKRDYEKALNEFVYKKTWEAKEEEDLADVIADNVGWCIKKLEYVIL